MVPLEWGDGKSYQFEGILLTKKEKSSKRVWLGTFLKNAPQGLESGVEYCLKQITVAAGPMLVPQGREYYELVAFRGQHQREILAQDQQAREAEQEIRQYGRIQKNYIAVVVEPVYEGAKAFFEKYWDVPYDNEKRHFSECWKIPVVERLGLIEQCAIGVQELRADENQLGGLIVDAHRDLKWDNYVVEVLADGTICIRLIDYASIHLEKERIDRPKEDLPDLDGTFGCAMSPANTAPEDLNYIREWHAGATTDVYALGMMLASLFLQKDEKYINPNTEWIAPYWPKNKQEQDAKDREASDAFHDCQEKYDVGDGLTTWVEKALSSRGMVLRWEDLPDEEVLNGIRQLFRRATHIDPGQRISLDVFINELQRISKLAGASKAKNPVSLYLFEQTRFTDYTSIYEQAAVEAFRMEEQEARQNGVPVPRAMCISYRHRLPHDTPERGEPVCKTFPCRTERDLSDYIRMIRTSNGRGKDQTVRALDLACCKLVEEKWDQAYEFTGNIHLFCEEIPERRDMEAWQVMGTSYDVDRMCTEIRDAWNLDDLAIVAHSVYGTRADSEDIPWCYLHLLPRVTDDHDHESHGESKGRTYGKITIILEDGSKLCL